MPYCPTHGYQQGKHCTECGALLSDSPPPAGSGDSIRVRSPEATAIVNFVPPTKAPPRPAEVECPRCGHFKALRDTFNCKGECSRQNLCRRHFDEEYEVCVDCADTRRGIAGAEAERQAKLHADLAAQRRRAEQAEASVAALTQRSQQAETTVSQRATALSQAQKRVDALEKDLAGWRSRAEKAEGELATIERARQEAEAQKQAEAEAARRRAAEAKRQQEAEAQKQSAVEAEAARRRAEEVKRQQPAILAIWQRIGIELVRIPAGEFFYGDDKHKTRLPEYWLAKTPVTNAQYAIFVKEARHPAPGHWQGDRIPAGKENHPVVRVSWDDAKAFCGWAGLRLPTEKEWEKGARGSDGREYPWGSQAPDEKLCIFNRNVKNTTPVGKYPAGASPYGLLDMAGNVWEWCADWYDSEYKHRVLRGGSWYDDARNVRAAVRGWNSPGARDGNFGFRCARPL